jgi:CTP-dependent riboflavin kinase
VLAVEALINKLRLKQLNNKQILRLLRKLDQELEREQELKREVAEEGGRVEWGEKGEKLKRGAPENYIKSNIKDKRQK